MLRVGSHRRAREVGDSSVELAAKRVRMLFDLGPPIGASRQPPAEFEGQRASHYTRCAREPLAHVRQRPTLVVGNEELPN
jgi:hypothetical protein